MEPKIFSSGKKRPGRGFSHQELKKANIDVHMAKKLGLRIDKRRKTSYERNIKILKKKAEDDKKRREQKGKKKAKGGVKKESKSAGKEKEIPKTKKSVKKTATKEKKDEE